MSSLARKIMVVADSTRESVEALEYTLSHVLVEEDELILINVVDPMSRRNPFAAFLGRSASSSVFPSFSCYEEPAPGEEDFLGEMKAACRMARPNGRVRVVRVHADANNKAAAILYKTQMLGVSLLVIGQRRSISNVISWRRRSGGWLDTAEDLIENSQCTCVGVQKKGQNEGYLLNTRTLKNFWLLA